jgi:hypothetical protein
MSFVKDHRGEHPVSYAGENFLMSPLTLGIKKQFCEWLMRQMLATASQYSDPLELKAFKADLFAAPPTWGVVPSSAVAASLASVEGQLMVTRLLLNVGPDDKPDEWVVNLLTEKNAEVASDYMTALALVMETADPKAKRG